MAQPLFHRNFLIMVIGQIISIFGNVILRFALSLYVMDLTGSALLFASFTAFAMLPTILLSPVGGMVADRVSKRDIMVVLDFATAALVLGFGLLLHESRAIPMIIGVMMLLAVIQSFYNPAVTASVPLLQSGENLVRGNAVVNQVTMIANLAGPVLGGVLYAMFGVRVLIFLGGVCFFGSAMLELFLRIPHQKRDSSGSALADMRGDFAESWRFLRVEQPGILKTMLGIGGFNFFCSALVTVGVPFLLRVQLGLGSELFGLSGGLVAAAGLAGGLIAGIAAARVRANGMYAMMIGCAGTLLPTAFCFLAGASAALSAVVIVACTMLSQLLSSLLSIVAMSAVQRATPAHMLGKVGAYIATLSMCAIPVGQAFYGLVLDLLARHVWIVFFFAALGTAAVSLFCRQGLRQLVVSDDAPRGIGPDPATLHESPPSTS